MTCKSRFQLSDMKTMDMALIQMADNRQSNLQNQEPILITQPNSTDDTDEKRSVTSFNLPRESNAEKLKGLADDSHSFQFLESSKHRRSKTSKRGYHSGKKSQAYKKHHRTPYSYLKPGALAQFRDAQRSARTVHSSIRRGIVDDGKTINTAEEQAIPSQTINAEQALASSDFSCRVFRRSYGPACLHRKKLLAPKAEVLLASTQVSAASSASEITEDSTQESLFEGLPLELLVRIVCKLQHDQIKPAFHVCKRLCHAVVIAKQNHFNYTTPGRVREPQMIPRPLMPHSNQLPFLSRVGGDGGPARHPGTPKAPRHAPKPQAARISVAEMRQIAASLFPGSRNRVRQGRQPCLPKPVLRSGSSHRVLFNEEELCQAIAQNSLSI
ncbi:hypothetical protein O6H91_14G030200 [Diphasiastrum complanatum]|uniref:Uncharacterized protein n=1 Tax=Diphasiastrum complanatum TaxID=34168 RepID=A0ACC2BMP2_DIPCM|nr:hypothetical protein O6H91_14G030200 [Diphasiastrum complanatum]